MPDNLFRNLSHKEAVHLLAGWIVLLLIALVGGLILGLILGGMSLLS